MPWRPKHPGPTSGGRRPGRRSAEREATDVVIGEVCECIEIEAEMPNGAPEHVVRTVTENAKTRTAHYLAARVDEAARQSVEQQSRAMADAARVAFNAELGATLQRLQAAMQPLIERSERPWERWLTYAATAAATSAFTLVLAVSLWAR